MDRRYANEICECGDPFCAGCFEPENEMDWNELHADDENENEQG